MSDNSALESLYWRDFPDWSVQQAAALRALAGRADLPNALDLGHLIEEVEDLGNSATRGVASLLKRILEHLIKLHLRPGTRGVRHWQAEIVNWHGEVLRDYAPLMRGKLDLDAEWRRASAVALRRLPTAGVRARLPIECPIPLDTLLTDPIDIDGAVAAIAVATAASD